MIAELQEKGWYLTQEGIDACKEGIDKVTLSSVIRKALDTDLRDIGSSFLSEEIYRNKVDTISGPCVLQVQKIKDVSVPKYETSNNGPALYRMHVTDGITTVSCLQCGIWKSINLDTPPGTKILFKANKIPVLNGFLLLKESHFTVLGGQVPALVEKWELKKRLASHVRRGDSSDDGPPPWIPFGKSIRYKDSKTPNDFKSLEQDAKEEKEDNAVFKQQRQAHIAEVSKVKEGKVKVFGGGKEKSQSGKPEENAFEKPYKNSQGSLRRGQALLETPASVPLPSQPSNDSFGAPKYEREGQQNPFHKRNDKDRFKKFDSRNNMDDGQRNFSNNSAYTSSRSDRNSQNYSPMKNEVDRTSYRNNMNRMDESIQRFSQMNFQANNNHADNQKNRMFSDGVCLQPGYEVLARYWEDNRFYPATVHAVGENGTCVVYFVEYGNYEEVRVNDIRPLSSSWNHSLPDVSHRSSANSYPPLPEKTQFTGVLEFRRGGNKPFVHRSAAGEDQRPRERSYKIDARPSPKLYQVPNQRQTQ